MYSKSYDFNAYNVAITLPILKDFIGFGIIALEFECIINLNMLVYMSTFALNERRSTFQLNYASVIFKIDALA
jgi:hypothetical protein